MRSHPILALLAVSLFISAARAQDPYDVTEHYSRSEHMVPMRDGVSLYTQVYAPVASNEEFPIMISRTPYGVGSYGSDEFRRSLGPSAEFMREGFVFVYQDVRGKGQSEGEFLHHPVFIADKKGSEDIDEASDFYDTVEWLLANVPNHNGKVGEWGISYGGWETAMGMISGHPALVASSPQGTPGDQFTGDDYHHYGAFRLLYAFSWTAGNARIRGSERVTVQGADAYDFFLDVGAISNVNKTLFKDQVPTWNEFMEHGTYDAYWQSKNVMDDMHGVTHPVLNVVGWFDAEDYFGALGIYYSIEAKNPTNESILVIGPWSHGGWARSTGSSLGPLSFGSNTAEYFRESIQFPFFVKQLKGKGTGELPEAMVFVTGSNRWQSFDRWPPEEAESRNLYLRADGHLSFDAPTMSIEDGIEDGFDSYVSDPADPVRYTAERRRSQGNLWIIEDQRFVADRSDVLVYETDVLSGDLTIAGPILASLNVATTGTDADWVIKLIDVLPEDAEGDLAGAQIMLAGEVFRSKFRNSFAEPEPMVPNEITEIEYDLLDKAHTFLKGHKIMVQIQSTWFPLIDRNTQKFTNIYDAVDADYQLATHRVYRSRDFPTHLKLNIIDR